MTGLRTPLASSVLLLFLAAPLWAADPPLKTVEAAAEVVQSLAGLPVRAIPPALIQDARGVAVFPHVLKAGLLVGGRFGTGVLLVRQPDGCWSEPVFITLVGGGFGLQAGVESTDVVLVFKTNGSLDRLRSGRGQLTLGGDVSVAAGPVGREAEAATDVRLQAEVFSYSRSRGLFAGAALGGDKLQVDQEANEEFYGARGIRPGEARVLPSQAAAAAVVRLKTLLAAMGPAPAPPPVFVRPPPGR
jgi:lipid-binding SYLF domain-containing protein